MRELNGDTSYGFAVIDFARDVLQEPLDPWQEWLVIHAGELLPDGRPRFREVLVLVARQAGKTHALKVLGLFWQFVERWPLIVGMSTNLSYAQESWGKAVEAAEANPVLAALVPRNGVRRANGEQCLTTTDRCRYKIAASNRRGGRSLSIDRLVLDELREHYDWSAWNAAVPAMNARPYAQVFAISNQGDYRSVVLNSVRSSALEFISTGRGDPRLGLFEWSSPEGADLDDVHALAQANPNAGRRVDWDALLGPARRAKAAGGAEEAGFRTEVMCQAVVGLKSAVDPARWAGCKDPGELAAHRSRVVLCVDLSLDEQHATLAAAAMLPDGRVRVEAVKAWSGPSCTADLRRELAAEVKRVRPRALGWFPGGPAAALAADLAAKKATGWPPPGVLVDEIRTDVPAVCMGFASLVRDGQIAHSGDPLLDAHVTSAEKLSSGDRWRFTRRSAGHCDAAYAVAGAVHLARTLPAVGRQRLVTAAAKGGGPDGAA